MTSGNKSLGSDIMDNYSRQQHKGPYRNNLNCAGYLGTAPDRMAHTRICPSSIWFRALCSELCARAGQGSRLRRYAPPVAQR